MPRPVVIIHFQPLESYPPVQNLLEFISSNHPATPVTVITTRSTNNSLGRFAPGSKNIQILRLGKSGTGLSALQRYWTYVLFNLGALWLLLVKRAASLLYFETLSALPAYIYKRFFAARIPLFIHYHEYVSPAEYTEGPTLVSWIHAKEKKLYPLAAWISQTNADRLERFLADEQLPAGNNNFVLPNYPPRKWNHVPAGIVSLPVKIVYAGALSLDTMYTEGFATWVHQQQGRLSWDIYTQNCTAEARAFIEQLQSPYIRMLNGVDYYQLASILPAYDAGVILYKGHIPNYVYNAPNKLFEYLACGLDVWFPVIMKGCLPYITENTYPKVVALDFMQLQQLNPETITGRNNCTFKPSVYFSEQVLPSLTQKLVLSAW